MHPKMGLWATTAAPQPGIAWPIRGHHPAGSVLSWALGRGTWGRDPSWGPANAPGWSLLCLPHQGRAPLGVLLPPVPGHTPTPSTGRAGTDAASVISFPLPPPGSVVPAESTQKTFWVKQEGWLTRSSPRLTGATEQCMINLLKTFLRIRVFFLCCETRARALVCNSFKER